MPLSLIAVSVDCTSAPKSTLVRFAIMCSPLLNPEWMNSIQRRPLFRMCRTGFPSWFNFFRNVLRVEYHKGGHLLFEEPVSFMHSLRCLWPTGFEGYPYRDFPCYSSWMFIHFLARVPAFSFVYSLQESFFTLFVTANA